ncbi:acetyltransferase [Leptospira interrogans]|uniref:acetyltransferase n=1 Tax=Leptospira interrogans TaxID=173 RepID=UPI0002BC3D24|nr:acetyltransferase [Leptospira interrogans]MCR8648943.1 acetyltransferase [Leptospira interrogans serovar Bataviae]OAM73296.1 acetyltransferase [Leptospira interrogans serovar Bataviae]QOI38168.1 acetyltransferase [Leptospira interrogans serovar Bataviae]QYY61725.1 acetyltransferase [Leptospira interrogans serovar Bataviae]
MKEEIILIGAGGHARSCIDVIESEGKYSIFGLVGTEQELGLEILGYNVVGTDKDLEKLHIDCRNAIVTVGQIKNPEPRIRIFQLLKKIGFSLPVIISPKAYISRHSAVGEGSIIMHHVIVNSSVQIGNNCIINSKVLLEHDVKIGNHCHISTGAILNGKVVVGDASFIGSGSIIKETVSIGSNSLVAMGSKILADLPDNSKYKIKS